MSKNCGTCAKFGTSEHYAKYEGFCMLELPPWVKDKLKDAIGNDPVTHVCVTDSCDFYRKD